jgi:hypothetical protein
LAKRQQQQSQHAHSKLRRLLLLLLLTFLHSLPHGQHSERGRVQLQPSPQGNWSCLQLPGFAAR